MIVDRNFIADSPIAQKGPLVADCGFIPKFIPAALL